MMKMKFTKSMAVVLAGSIFLAGCADRTVATGGYRYDYNDQPNSSGTYRVVSAAGSQSFSYVGIVKEDAYGKYRQQEFQQYHVSHSRDRGLVFFLGVCTFGLIFITDTLDWVFNGGKKKTGLWDSLPQPAGKEYGEKEPLPQTLSKVEKISSSTAVDVYVAGKARGQFKPDWNGVLMLPFAVSNPETLPQRSRVEEYGSGLRLVIN